MCLDRSKEGKPSLVGRIKGDRGSPWARTGFEGCGKKLKVGYYKDSQAWAPDCTYV